MMEQRPRNLTPEMRATVGAKLAEILTQDGHISQSETANAARDIAKHLRPHMDGYHLASNLDSYEMWNCDFDIAESLNECSALIEDEIEKAQKAWVERNKIVPTIVAGTRVTFGRERGEVTGVYEFGVAKYLIAVDGDPNSSPPSNARRIVAFEDVRAESTEVSL